MRQEIDHKKKTVKQRLSSICFYSLEGDLQDLGAKFNDIYKQYEKDYILKETSVPAYTGKYVYRHKKIKTKFDKIYLSYQQESYDDNYELAVIGERKLTQDELVIIQKEETEDEESRLDAQYRQYKELKKIFKDKD
jgi:hypothetical protein